MLRISSIVIVALAVLGALGTTVLTREVSTAANGVVFSTVSTPDQNGVSVLQFTVNPDNLNATVTAVSQGGSGHFTSAFSIGPCAATSSSLQISYQGSCLVTAGPTGTPVAGSAQWQCDTNGLVRFDILQGANSDSRQITCSPATSSTNSLLFVTASPNVVPCGGRTLITANIRDISGNIAPNTVVHFDTDQGLLDPSGPNTAVLTVYPGMTSARVRASVPTATSGVATSDVLVQVFCPTPTVQGTPGTAPGAATMTLTANPGAVERCGGTVFVLASVKDSTGRPAADGTTVLFIASGGTISTDSATTVAGTATITFTADRTMTGSVKISAQAGAAFASVNIPIACTASEAARAGIATPTRPSSSPNSSSSSNGDSNGSSASIPPPISSAPTFLPPRTGEASDFPVIIRPPSTGQAGLKTAD